MKVNVTRTYNVTQTLDLSDNITRDKLDDAIAEAVEGIDRAVGIDSQQVAGIEVDLNIMTQRSTDTTWAAYEYIET